MITRMPRLRRFGITKSASLVLLAAGVGSWLITSVAMAEDRKFLVILATSPKQFGGTLFDPLLSPTGLTPRQVIHNAYFDIVSPDVASFAEYWEEISYGDITITGQVTDWISLPWPINPRPGFNPFAHADLNQGGNIEYGASELFNIFQGVVPVDLDGDPGGNDNGPFSGPFGGLHVSPKTGRAVYKPGERFADVDGDGKWDGMDEANNWMDHILNAICEVPDPFSEATILVACPNGRPDNLGPWVDLDGDGEANNEDDCVYFRDSDNDTFPDCCPQPGELPDFSGVGPGELPPDFELNDFLAQWPCSRFIDGPTACQPTSTDCNGNGIPDDVDIRIGLSQDELPRVVEDGACVPGDGDGIPDECQFTNFIGSTPGVPVECADNANANEEDPCNAVPLCVEIAQNNSRLPDDLGERCEFDDANNNGALDIVEPFENFMRRWNPCSSFDPDNPLTFERWIPVYRPFGVTIVPPEGGDPDLAPEPIGYACPIQDEDGNFVEEIFDIRADTTLQTPTIENPTNPGQMIPNPLFAPSYIERNFPGDHRRLEAEAYSRPIFGQHDPLRILSSATPQIQCICAVDVDGVTSSLDDPRPCRNFDINGDGIIDPITETDVCLAGIHADYNPPDDWDDITLPDPDPNTDFEPGQFTTKIKTGVALGNLDGGFPDDENTPGRNDRITPKPGSYTRPGESTPIDEPWYDQAWHDRYNAVFETLPESERPPVSEPPPWPVGRFSFTKLGGDLRFNSPAIQTLNLDPDNWDPVTERRGFRADFGGTRVVADQLPGGLRREGVGIGWEDDSVAFTTFNVIDPTAFEDPAGDFDQVAILPEEVNGSDQPGIYFDGYVEHDDLPSSKYHMAGDRRLGEATSPFSDSREGNDFGAHILGDTSPTQGDQIWVAAGPYAKGIHGTLGRDAGNQLLIEYLTWRTDGRSPTYGFVWEEHNTPRDPVHPYAGSRIVEEDGELRLEGENFGFRDYNLDGLLDQGEVRRMNTESYTQDVEPGTVPFGTDTFYPWNRQRLLEDAMEIVDEIIDLDDFVDTASLARVAFPGSTLQVNAPSQITGGGVSTGPASGLVSGIVLLPPGGQLFRDFIGAPGFFPIHNEDTDDAATIFPSDPNSPQKINWNLLFHDLVIAEGATAESTVAPGGFQTSYAAHEYLHSWERFPDLYDFDIYFPNQGAVLINRPVGAWDIMAAGGLVHPIPIFKELPGTEWIVPVDLTTVVTPGVATTITMPQSEFVRNDSYFFLENENRLGERYYFWSAGSGFDQTNIATGAGLPASPGMLILHTDVGSNPDATPPLAQNGSRFTYLIVQADGLGELESGLNFGEGGDIWPGLTSNTKFGLATNPSATWYTQNSWTGLEILNIRPDGLGSVAVDLVWTPTSIPSLTFTTPPGGTSVGSTFQINTLANDVFGGTEIRFFFTTDENDISTSAANFIGSVQKRSPGIAEMSVDWNLSTVPDGRYLLFAQLVPGSGADGVELEHTNPRAGRNNAGNGTLDVLDVDVPGVARLETWSATCVDIGNGQNDFLVLGTISQPDDDAANSDPARHVFLDRTVGASTDYTSIGQEVSFNIVQGNELFDIGDTFTFTTTGKTAMSEPVAVNSNRITEGPVAIIEATPLSGLAPLGVSFVGRDSFDPTGVAVQHQWTFGDGTDPVTEPSPFHRFTQNGSFTVTLRVTNPQSGLFDEAFVDIEVINNSPKAVINAQPDSGPTPLLVLFSAAQSSDTETSANEMLYEWDFGDGQSASSGVAGERINVSHFYSQPGTFTVILRVTDSGGKQDTATVDILVGNTRPVANITHGALSGADPHEVVFNASLSFDQDGDAFVVTWIWGDGTDDETLPPGGEGGDGAVPHVYRLPAGTDSASFRTRVILTDERGAVTEWPGATVTVNEAGTGPSDPRAEFTVTPSSPVLGQTFTVDASLSFDRPDGGSISNYLWDFGDGISASGITAEHIFAKPGTFTITLTIEDDQIPPNTASTSRTFIITGEAPEDGENRSPIAIIVANPQTGLAGETSILFDGSQSADPDDDDLEFFWDLSDGTTSTQALVQHTFAEPGTYQVRLTVSDPDGATGRATQQIVITGAGANQPPLAFITTGPRTGTAPISMSFDGSTSFDPDGDALIFGWIFTLGNEVFGDALTGPQVSRFFEDPGVYSVELVVTDSHGAVGRSGRQTITVTARVDAPDEPPPGQDDPDDVGGGDPVNQRPFCGFGMIMALFGNLLGLTAMMVNRRRSRR